MRINLPNALTLARLVVAAASFACLELAREPARQRLLLWVAFSLFMVAACTDFLDGWLARRWKQVTALGRVLDPFADKVLTCGAMILLLEFQAARELLPGWVVVVTVAREFLVTALRGIVEAAGKPFPADSLGKAKMVLQCAACAGLITIVAGATIWWWPTVLAIWWSLMFTLVSGVSYCLKARTLLAQ